MPLIFFAPHIDGMIGFDHGNLRGGVGMSGGGSASTGGVGISCGIAKVTSYAPCER